MKLDRYGYRHYRRIAVPLLKAVACEMSSRPFVLVPFLRRVAVQGAQLVVRLVKGRLSYMDVKHEEHSAMIDSLPEPGKTCHMMAFCVDPTARGQQLGSQMLRRFNEEMAGRGPEWCLAETTTDNVASQVAQCRAGLECVAQSGQDLIFVGRIAGSA
jgi:ribosomal protein S18 acetylase RimI-like enzyme